MAGYRGRESYIAKSPEAWERQLAGLRKGWGQKRSKKELEGEVAKGERPPDLDSVRYKDDVVAFVEEQFYTSPVWTGEGGMVEGLQPIRLVDWQKDWLRAVFHSGATYSLAMLGAPKKTGKSCLMAAICAWELFHGQAAGQIFLAASDANQANWITFSRLQTAIRANKAMFSRCNLSKDSIENKATGTVVRSIPADVSIAGVEPTLTIFDELHLFRYEHLERFYEELCSIPTRRSLRIVSTYAGIQGEANLLWRLYEQGRAGDDARYFFRWYTDPMLSPWITQEYLDGQRKQLRESTFRRLHLNEWASGEESFITGEEFSACVNGRLLQGDAAVSGAVYLGVDAAVKSDCSAIAAVYRDGDMFYVADHRVFEPTKGCPVSLESVEGEIVSLSERYAVQAVYFDPSQFLRSAESLRSRGLPMVEYPQNVGRMVKASELLHSLIRAKEINWYPSKELRQHLLNCAVKEHPEGWRIVKQRQDRKIDLGIALALACMAALEGGGAGPQLVVLDLRVSGKVKPETAEERFQRMMNDERCWQTFGSELW